MNCQLSKNFRKAKMEGEPNLFVGNNPTLQFSSALFFERFTDGVNDVVVVFENRPLGRLNYFNMEN